MQKGNFVTAYISQGKKKRGAKQPWQQQRKEKEIQEVDRGYDNTHHKSVANSSQTIQFKEQPAKPNTVKNQTKTS
eukprot:m.31381 g.31381  ORF g.31381 m.31381 type:complete len:75 (+) comp10685_c0_seq1:176-400(+)